MKYFENCNLLKKYFFYVKEREGDKMGKRRDLGICWFTPQIVAMDRGASGQNQDPETPYRFPKRAAGTQEL